MRRHVLVMGLVAALAAGTLDAADDDGFVPLFNGTDLNGWTGDPDLWTVEDGCIVGCTDDKQIPRNTFLHTEKTYGDFVLRISFRLRNHNSGVQIRSAAQPNWVVKGYQADIAQRRYTGILYEEGGRGILADVDPAKVAEHLQQDGWNQYVITCRGPRITLELNGIKTVDYTEEDPQRGAREGVIGLQLHKGPGMRVEFKGIELRELD